MKKEKIRKQEEMIYKLSLSFYISVDFCSGDKVLPENFVNDLMREECFRGAAGLALFVGCA